jgi:hypothetical protein
LIWPKELKFGQDYVATACKRGMLRTSELQE